MQEDERQESQEGYRHGSRKQTGRRLVTLRRDYVKLVKTSWAKTESIGSLDRMLSVLRNHTVLFGVINLDGADCLKRE